MTVPTVEQISGMTPREIHAAWSADARDAMRYRWLRNGNGYEPERAGFTGGVNLDRLCDSEGKWP